jgi:methyl-accepting chemotaxis protein
MARMEARVRAAVSRVKLSSREVSNASAEIATATTDLSQRTEEQAASLEQTSAAMEEIASVVRKNSEHAQAVNRSASEARAIAERGGEVAVRATDAMSRIEQSSRKIADIIGVIEEIARQTNLLALNAAVEAARAGEAGRGFAVVATEVRSLAQRSGTAAKDIEKLIKTSGEEVKAGVALVNQAGVALTEVRDAIATVADTVRAIADATAEQASGIDEVNKALTQMDDLTQRNSALVEENAATAMALEQQARAMDEQMAYFQVDEADRVAPAGPDGGARERPAEGEGSAWASAAA